MKNNKQTQKCYMCDTIATTKEHVPPLCLFPEKKDIETDIFRTNLITVPSCEIHNSKKSKDDEFLMGCLAGVVGNNAIGFFHADTKVRRALKRKGRDFIHELMTDVKEINLNSAKNYKFPVLVGLPDLKRLHSCFRHISHGLFYNKFGVNFIGKIHIVIDFITYEDPKIEQHKLLCRKRFELEANKSQKEGNNQKVFLYEFIEPDEFGLIAMSMTFYEGAKVFVSFQGNDTIEPKNFLTELIKSGVKTFVKFDDGSNFEIN